jgi:hypothetical protein
MPFYPHADNRRNRSGSSHKRAILTGTAVVVVIAVILGVASNAQAFTRHQKCPKYNQCYSLHGVWVETSAEAVPDNSVNFDVILDTRRADSGLSSVCVSAIHRRWSLSQQRWLKSGHTRTSCNRGLRGLWSIGEGWSHRYNWSQEQVVISVKVRTHNGVGRRISWHVVRH